MKKVTVVTTSRADYGIFYPLLKEFSNDDELKADFIYSLPYVIAQGDNGRRSSSGGARSDHLQIQHKAKCFS